MTKLSNSQKSKLLRKLSLSGIFLACFVIPVLLVTRAGLRERESLSTPEDSTPEKLFPNAVTIGKAGKFLKVGHQPNLIPSGKSDFVLLFWVRLKELPAPGERLVLLSKYSGKHPKIQGYAVGIRRDGNSTRPILYWGNGIINGTWYDFPDVALAANEWAMFALHVHDGKFVSMYSAFSSAGQPPALQFLGGHELSNVDSLAVGEAEILFGSPSGRDFRGKIGPIIAVAPFSKGAESLPATLESYIKNPLEIATLGSSSEIALAILDGRKDSSRNKYETIVNY